VNVAIGTELEALEGLRAKEAGEIIGERRRRVVDPCTGTQKEPLREQVALAHGHRRLGVAKDPRPVLVERRRDRGEQVQKAGRLPALLRPNDKALPRVGIRRAQYRVQPG
jgi:hypothetical protein